MAKCWITFHSGTCTVRVSEKKPVPSWGQESYEVDIRASLLKHFKRVQNQHDRTQKRLWEFFQHKADNPDSHMRYGVTE